jgi:hypothetical protein
MADVAESARLGLVMRPSRIFGAAQLTRRPKPEGIDRRTPWPSEERAGPGRYANILQGYLETIHVNHWPRSSSRLSTGDCHTDHS